MCELESFDIVTEPVSGMPSLLLSHLNVPKAPGKGRSLPIGASLSSNTILFNNKISFDIKNNGQLLENNSQFFKE